MLEYWIYGCFLDLESPGLVAIRLARRILQILLSNLSWPQIKVGDNSLEKSSEKFGLSLTKFDQLNWDPTGQSLISFKPLTVSTLDLIIS